MKHVTTGMTSTADAGGAANALPAAAYERAERMLGHHRPRLALRARVQPNWLGDDSGFWYRVETERGAEFVLVEVAARSRRAAFDHERLARSLSRTCATEVRPYALPFDTIEVSGGEVRFTAFGAQWSLRLADYQCRPATARPVSSPLESASPESPSPESVSPDGAWVAFRRGHDLWLRSAAGGEEFALTTDGTEERGYAINPDYACRRQMLKAVGRSEPPVLVVWSPDSSRVLTHRLDQRGVARMPLVEALPPDGGRPRSRSYHYPMPGETRPRGEWLIFDLRSRPAAPAKPGSAKPAPTKPGPAKPAPARPVFPQPVPAQTEPFLFPHNSPIPAGAAWWSADSTTVYYLDQPRDLRTLYLKAIDAATGEVRTLIEERGATRVEAAQDSSQKPMVRVLPGGDKALWYSQRDGWGHHYLYDLATAKPLAQLTNGAFAVQEIVHVDETHAYLVVSGLVPANPYHRSLVRVGLDGGGMIRLTDDDLDHVVTAPPHGRWFVDSASAVDTPPVITVRGSDGAVLVELERADISPLRDAGWTAPEPIRTVAADGETPIYGVLYKPYGFDSGRRYPVVDHVYPGPHTRRVRHCFDPGWYGHEAEAIAALGFVVLAIDGRGTPGRDKAFHDHSYRNLGSCGGLEDHVVALRQLAETRPWMDLDRVGIFGLSAGGFAATRALLAYPDIYKVGVAEAGNHDNRQLTAVWAETYDGPFHTAPAADPATAADAGARLSNTELAENLTGRLLLIHGELDEGVTPHLTMRLVDRLIAADKDFDLLIVPGAEHLFIGYQDYVTRRRWDYLVRHLMRLEPPEYRIAPVPITPDMRKLALGG
jgi:dipeptidyl-peptidase-4